MIPSSLFNQEGIDVGEGRRSLAYLYGLSDFFSFVFEDTETINLLMEANAVSASEIYSRFLQMTSSFSLEDVQTHTASSISLVLLKESDRIGTTTKYKINKPIASVKCLANRPFLPSQILEPEVDFRLIQEDLQSCIVQFARPLSEYSFSRRNTSQGEEIAIWAVDAHIDEQLMYTHFGKLIKITPQKSSEAFSNFIYGLYFLYQNGPTLQVMERGLNLLLGIPLSRKEEAVIDIRNYLETDNYLVITDTNQYLLPPGVTPSVRVGETLQIGQSLSRWVELNDHLTKDHWWINISIPSSIIRRMPSGQQTRIAETGSPFDKMFQEYLYKNTFLIKINVNILSSSSYFEEIDTLVNKIKPGYTTPLYVWRVEIDEDNFGIEDDSLSIVEETSLMTSINSQPIDSCAI